MDMSKFIIAKSDQLNSDDLIGGPITVTITGVRGTDAADQPVAVNFEGDDGKPYKPCKSMRRVMVGVWGADASKYVGRSMTLYREAEVQFGGMKVGGIRISHMSGLTEKKTMALTATRGKKGMHTVHPLSDAPAPNKDDPAAKWAGGYIARLATFSDLAALQAFEMEKAGKLAELKNARPELHAEVEARILARKADLSGNGFEDDLSDEPKPSADGLRTVLRSIEDAKTLEDVDRIDRESEPHRTFLGDTDLAKLDETLAARRSELRETAGAE